MSEPRKPRLYLAGAINGKSDEEVFGWRRQAARELRDLYEIHDPAERDFRGVEASNVATIVESDLKEIRYVDALLVRAEAPSWGTAMEVRFAHELGLHVVSFGAGDRPSPWLLYHSDHRRTLELAIAHFRHEVKF